MWTVFVVLLTLAARFTAFDNEGEKVYLHQLTIYKTHEIQFLLVHDPPEVYLTCDDGLPVVDLERVRRTDTLYTFEAGKQPTTRLGKYGCVTCALKESDFITEDDVFGKWEMCLDDFEVTGSVVVGVKGEFKALFACPDCKYVEPLLVAPSVPPEQPPEVDSPPSVAPEVDSPPSVAPEVESPPSVAPEVESPPSEPPEVESPPSEPPEVESTPSVAPEVESPPSEPPEVEGPVAGVTVVEGSKVAVPPWSPPYSAPAVQPSSDSDYDDIVDEMVTIDMDDLIAVYRDAHVQ